MVPTLSPQKSAFAAGWTAKLRAAWQLRWIKLAVATLGVLAVALLVVAEIFAQRFQPLLRERVVATLSEQLHRPVALDSLDISVLRGLQVEGKGLHIASPPPQAPLLTVKVFRFRISFLDLIHLRPRVETVHLEDLEAHVPSGQSAPTTAAGPSASTAAPLFIGEVVCTDAHISLEGGKPGAAPLRFEVEHLDLKDVSTSTAVAYSADIVYPQPKARIHVAGDFGPWNAASPGATALDGSYSTKNVDLSAIAGLAGKVSSSGRFSGTLAGLTVDGDVESPSLALQESAHPVKMDAAFHLLVDGTTGDTTFSPVRVTLPRGVIVAQGKMQILPPGPDIDMDVSVPRGRVEELLEIGTNSRPTLMSGNLTLHAHLHIPPGQQNVEQKMQATGSLTVDGITMGDPKLQQSINSLSGISQGNLKVLAGALPAGGSSAPPVTSNITATYSLAGGLMTVPSLTYTVPGSHVQLAGVYSLARNAFEFRGHYVPGGAAKPAPAAAAQPEPAKKSFGLSGFFQKASPLLQRAQPLLQKVLNVQVPILITGVGSNVKLSITSNADAGTAQMAADLPNLH